ncbi:MAG TPA: hypothetical protein VF002_03355 [Gaiellaceae bacterium]
MRALPWLLGLVTASGLFCACGGSSVASGDLAKAATMTAQVRSYSVTTTTSMNLPGSAQPVTFTGQGSFAPRARRGRMTLDMSQLNQVLGPQGSPYNFGYAQLVLAGTDLYMRLPFLRQLSPQLKPWIKINLGAAGKAAGIDFSSFLQFGQGGDPTQSLQFLRAAGRLRKLGTDSVRGVPTTHYGATIELAQVAKAVPARLRPELQKTVDQLVKLTGERSIPVEVWVDRQGLVRRESYTETLTLRGQPTRLQNSMELYDFGVPVIAPLPPAADVTDLTGAPTGSPS